MSTIEIKQDNYVYFFKNYYCNKICKMIAKYIIDHKTINNNRDLNRAKKIFIKQFQNMLNNNVKIINYTTNSESDILKTTLLEKINCVYYMKSIGHSTQNSYQILFKRTYNDKNIYIYINYDIENLDKSIIIIGNEISTILDTHQSMEKEYYEFQKNILLKKKLHSLVFVSSINDANISNKINRDLLETNYFKIFK